MTGGLWFRFLSGPDIDSLDLSSAEIVAAVEDAVRAHGDGRTVVEPRVHLVPDNQGAGHFNLLRGHLPVNGPSAPGTSTRGVSGVKVVGDFVANYAAGAVELDLLDVMDKVVVDDWREAQSGSFGALRRHVDTGRLSAASLHAELGQIVTGRRPGRERDDERILLWHRGLAILDIAVGLAILRRAEQQGAGTMLRYR